MSETRQQTIDRLQREGVSPANIKTLRTLDPPMPVAEIARLYGITRQGVYHHIKGDKQQLSQPNKEAVKKLRPFSVPAPQQKCGVYNMLSAQLEYRLDPKGLSAYQTGRLKSWWKNLAVTRNLIIVHDPDQEPNDLARCGGWRYEKRMPTDGDMVVRPHGEVTDEQRKALSVDFDSL
ncbi:hypothetical protein ABZV77_11485 [Streptomyces sp. NPDC004732]|uniref:hypothetical protein n=1 Tax=Streptomyces sp. NPDC004732 TaxID=3154290 RepID=UPI0033A8C10C